MEPLTWVALEHENKERSTDWYWALGIIAISGAGASIIFGNVLFAIVIIVGSSALALNASKPPEEITFGIDSKGLYIGETLYPYNTLESFWIVHGSTQSGSKLLITSKKVFVPHLIIPIADVSPESVHAFLVDSLEEVEQEESFLQKVVEKLGF